MIRNKKIIVITGLSLFTIAGIAGIKRPAEEEKFKNLKVLSKNIDDEQMERIMYNFDRQLGVSCEYCHDTTRNVFPARADFASDAKKEKLVAREMLRMSLSINKKYFDLHIDREIKIKPIVWCKTCHMGLPVPNNQ
ncbi:MAG: c-type cytochrome [Chitinophagaceae bacterium]